MSPELRSGFRPGGDRSADGMERRDDANPEPVSGVPLEVVTGIIAHDIDPEAHAGYERWLEEVRCAVRRFPGFLSADTIRPVKGQHRFTTIVRFEGVENLRTWLESEVRRRLLEKIEGMLERGDRVEVRTGLDFWFAAPGAPVRAPRPYKQFLIVLAVIYPLALLVPWALSPVMALGGVWSEPLVSRLLSSALIVLLMVYVIMPRLTRRVAHWLHR